MNFECIYMYVKSFLVNAKKKKKKLLLNSKISG